MPIVAALRGLDRRVLGGHAPSTPADWVKATGRWKLLLGVAVVECVTVVAEIALTAAGAGFFSPGSLVLFSAGILVSAVACAFQAGMLLSEHARTTGTETPLGRRRPPGT